MRALFSLFKAFIRTVIIVVNGHTVDINILDNDATNI